MNTDNRLLPWVELYRPTTMNEIKSQKHIIRTINNFLETKTFPHLLFYGPPGTGKTSTILCCARKLYGEYYSSAIMLINASNDRGIDTVRKTIKNFVISDTRFFLPENIRTIFKIVILDEIDSMTSDAQGVLRQTIEKYSATTRFCLICNEIDRVNLALQSRYAMFRFPSLSNKLVREKLLEICKSENIEYSNNAIESLVNVSKGDMRLSINLLQQIASLSDNKITKNDVYKLSNQCSPEIIDKIINILKKLISNKLNLNNAIIAIEKKMLENNITIPNILEKMGEYVINTDFPVDKKIKIINKLATFEIYDSVNVDSHINMINIISSFCIG